MLTRMEGEGKEEGENRSKEKGGRERKGGRRNGRKVSNIIFY